jgi:hypothetical protein
MMVVQLAATQEAYDPAVGPVLSAEQPHEPEVERFFSHEVVQESRKAPRKLRIPCMEVRKKKPRGFE